MSGARPTDPVLVDGGPVDRWLVDFARRLGELPGLVGMWVHGSAASGDWVPGVSDVDLVVVWEDTPAASERGPISEALLHAVEGCPIETDVPLVTRAESALPSPSPVFELYAERHPGSGPPRVWGPGNETGLLFDFEVARTRGIAIAGPPPSDVFGRVPAGWLLRAAEDGVGAPPLGRDARACGRDREATW